MELQEITQGNTAVLYAWKDNQVLKLFRDWFPYDGIVYEARVARAVYESGLSIPAVGEIVQVAERHGIVYGRVSGRSMMEVLMERPSLGETYAQQLADLQHHMHTSPIQPNIPHLHDRIRQRLSGLSPELASLRDALLARLETMPKESQLCHGDFHPGNVMVSDDGEIVIIDWIDAALGNPAADVARSSILMLGGIANVGGFEGELKKLVNRFHEVYFERYFSLNPGVKEEYERWMPLVAAARLLENVPGKSFLLAEAKKVFAG